MNISKPFKDIYIYINTHQTHMYVGMYVIYLFKHLCILKNIYIYIYDCMYACIYACMHLYT